MQFNSETARNDITIQGAAFTVPAPYAEGHTLTAGEASALNQLLTENVRNNFAGKMKAAKAKATETGEPEQTFSQEDLDAYVAEYEFGVRRAGGGRSEPLDPLARESRRIAKEMITNALKAKNITLKSVDPDKLETMISELSGREDIVKEATRRVKSVEKISIDGLDIAA